MEKNELVELFKGMSEQQYHSYYLDIKRMKPEQILLNKEDSIFLKKLLFSSDVKQKKM